MNGLLKTVPNFKLLVLAYAFAHIGMLSIMEALYWDDWVLFNNHSDDILSRFKMAGTAFSIYGYVHVFMQTIGPVGYKLLTLFLFLGSSILCYKILLRQNFISKENCYLIALLFSLLPFNFARVMEISLPYSISNFFFFLAWYLLIKNKISAIVLFFMSFPVQSFLVFYTVPILELYRKEVILKKYLENVPLYKKTIVWCFRNFVLLSLPFIFFIIKNLFYQPFGFYEGYNEKFGFHKAGSAFMTTFADVLELSVSLPLLVLTLFLARFFVPKTAEPRLKNDLLLLGAFIIILALLPYFILGISPVFVEWPSSRNQLLMPLGVAIFFVGIANSLNPVRSYYFIVLVVAVSLAINFNFYYQAYLDWQKQTLVVSFLKDSDLKKADVILIDDRTEARFGRTLGFYEWSGLVKLAYGDQNRFAMRREELPLYQKGDYDKYFISMYNVGAHKRFSENNIRVLIVDYIKLGGERTIFGTQKYMFRVYPLDKNI